MKISTNLKKDDLLEALKKEAETYPELAGIDPELTKDELIAQYEAVVAAAEKADSKPEEKPEENDQETPAEEEEGEVDKAELYARLLKEMPEAAVVPRTAMLLTLEHPTTPSLTYTIRAVAGELGSRALTLEEVTRRWKSPEDNYETAHREKVHATLLSDVPEWAREQIVDLVEDETLALYATVEEAEREESEATTHGKAILDNDVGRLDMKVVFAANTGSANPPMLVEPTGKFDRAEQECAWNVVNGFVEGEGPLPDDPEAINEDPQTITTEELMHVERRIQRCLEHPALFTERTVSKESFDQKMFFNQLLQIEYGGFTPRRNGNSKNGGVRKRIVKLLRQRARDAGFEVMGDYVINRQERGEIKPNLPTEPFTQNRTAELPFRADIGGRLTQTR